MTNPIADPLVEITDTDADSRLVDIDATLEGVATVTLNRAIRRNAFNAELIAALHEAFETLQGRGGPRGVPARRGLDLQRRGGPGLDARGRGPQRG